MKQSLTLRYSRWADAAVALALVSVEAVESR